MSPRWRVLKDGEEFSVETNLLVVMDPMSDVDTNGFSNAFDEHIRSISKQVVDEEFAKRQICEEAIFVDPEAIKL